ncbi:MAG: hypothetical protein ACMUIP_07825 [bacterium]
MKRKITSIVLFLVLTILVRGKPSLAQFQFAGASAAPSVNSFSFSTKSLSAPSLLSVGSLFAPPTQVNLDKPETGQPSGVVPDYLKVELIDEEEEYRLIQEDGSVKTMTAEEMDEALEVEYEKLSAQGLASMVQVSDEAGELIDVMTFAQPVEVTDHLEQQMIGFQDHLQEMKVEERTMTAPDQLEALPFTHYEAALKTTLEPAFVHDADLISSVQDITKAEDFSSIKEDMLAIDQDMRTLAQNSEYMAFLNETNLIKAATSQQVMLTEKPVVSATPIFSSATPAFSGAFTTTPYATGTGFLPATSTVKTIPSFSSIRFRPTLNQESASDEYQSDKRYRDSTCQELKKSYSKEWGYCPLVCAGFSIYASALARPTYRRFYGSNSEYVRIFNTYKSLVYAYAYMLSRSNPYAHVKLKLFGNTIYDSHQLNVNKNLSKSKSFTVSKWFWIGPIPVKVKLKAGGTVGMYAGYGVNTTQISAYVRPYTNTWTSGSVSVDVWLASAGITTTLNLLDESLPITASIAPASEGRVRLSLSIRKWLRALAGKIYIWVKILWKKWTKTLLNWSGVSGDWWIYRKTIYCIP